MTDDRFFPRRGPFTLGEIATQAQLELPPQVPPDFVVRGVAALDVAEADELSIFCDTRHADAFAASSAGAIVTSNKLSNRPHNGSFLLLARDPRLAFALIGLMFYPRATAEPGVHAGAHVDPSAVIGEGCQIDCGAVIGPLVRLGARSHVSANAVIGAAVEIGEGSVVGMNATITHALIGARARIGSGVVVGGEGFGVVAGPIGLVCSAQLGRVIIGDDVRVGSNSTIDRGAAGDTTIGDGTMIDNLVQIAHNVRIGRNCLFAGQAGVAGSTTIGDNVMVGGQTAISDHLVIGSNARIAGGSGVMRAVADGEAVAGCPAVPVRQWHRQSIALARSARKRALEA
ncbi:MAG TPA: UDP-3-O-(3-hydroxymyristoyl)glucosamine N-acyltransferase [Rhizomicrobium sp.]|nr:UDP-3-O-(3-hydroxymyristoyl)glucosamine N-acyltransferase [Rhizomicrobium sp.]